MLNFRFSLSSSLADLSSYDKRNIMNVKGYVMMALWLYGGPGTPHQFLDLSHEHLLELRINKSANYCFIEVHH